MPKNLLRWLLQFAPWLFLFLVATVILAVIAWGVVQIAPWLNPSDLPKTIRVTGLVVGFVSFPLLVVEIGIAKQSLGRKPLWRQIWNYIAKQTRNIYHDSDQPDVRIKMSHQLAPMKGRVEARINPSSDNIEERLALLEQQSEGLIESFRKSEEKIRDQQKRIKELKRQHISREEETRERIVDLLLSGSTLKGIESALLASALLLSSFPKLIASFF